MTLRSSNIGGKLEYNWSCGNRHHLPEGSRVFLIRLGDQPKGIVASGWCTRKSYRKGGRNYIDLTWDVLSANPVVDLSELQRSPFASFRWIIQASGFEIPPNIARDLSRFWDKRVALNRPKRANGAETAVEGLAREAHHSDAESKSCAPRSGDQAFSGFLRVMRRGLWRPFCIPTTCARCYQAERSRGIMRELSRPRPH